MPRGKRERQKGFTLIEALVLLIILGLLGSLAAPRFFNHEEKAQQKGVRSQLDRFTAALEAFRLDVGRYPTEQEGLAALVVNPGLPNWKGAYLKKTVPRDPWGNLYHYRNPGEHGEIDVFSYGKDNQPGGNNGNADLGNWQ